MTFATIITIHGDSSQAPDDSTLQSPKSSVHDYLLPPKIPPSPTTDETFDLSSKSGIPKDKAVGINQIDTILLAR